MKQLYFVLATMLALWPMGSLGARELVKNGNFNGSATGWTTGCTSVEASYYESTYGGSSSTNHVAEIDDESCFYQDVCILPGSSYTFSMLASRRISSSTPSTVTTHLKITGLNSSGTTVGTYVDMDFSRSNTTFAFTSVTGIPTIAVPTGAGVVRLRIYLTDNTSGTDTYGMIVDDLSLTFVTPPSIGGPDTTCMNAGTTYIVNDVATTDIYYAWTLGVGATPATSTAANPTVTWSSSGIKTLGVVLGNGFCYVDTEARTVFVGTGVTIARYDTICSNSGYSFGGVELTRAGSYTDTITGVGGCDSIINLHLYVQSLDTSYFSDSICQGATYAFDGRLLTTAGIYTANYTSTKRCDSLVILTLKIKATPSAPQVVTPVTYCQLATPLPLVATGSGLLWYTVATGGVGSSTAPTPSTTSPGDVYNYVSQTINGCESPRSTVLVRVTPKPTAGFNWVIAYGCTADTVQFINTSSNTTASFWYFGDTLALPEQEFSPVHLYPAANQAYQRNVKLVVYNGGCADSVVNTLNFLKNPNPPFRLSQVTPNQAITFGGSVQLNAGGATLYYWKPNDGSLNDANINNPIASPRQATTYTVYGYDASGCLDSAQVNIDVVTAATDYIPSAFTPNGDSKNDVFRIVGRPYERLVEMSIYNRWGEKVFSSNDIHKGWDGTWNGVPQDIGVYYYAIIIATQEGTNKTFSGPVTLIR